MSNSAVEMPHERLNTLTRLPLESQMAKHAFDTFIPLSVESDARKAIIFDFFELLAAIAANGKTNGLGGRKLSRLAGWWAFSHSDNGKGFDGGYRSWATYNHNLSQSILASSTDMISQCRRCNEPSLLRLLALPCS